MNSRERVLRAFKRAEGLPDRIPIQFDLCASLADHFGKMMNIPVHYTENPYEDVTYRISANELRIAMGSDVVITGALSLTLVTVTARSLVVFKLPSDAMTVTLYTLLTPTSAGASKFGADTKLSAPVALLMLNSAASAPPDIR